SAVNAPMGGNFTVAPDGYLWKSRNRAVNKIDPETGHIVKQYPLTKLSNSYDNIIRGSYYAAPDKNGEAWAGGMHSDYFFRLNPATGAVTEYPLPTLDMNIR